MTRNKFDALNDCYEILGTTNSDNRKENLERITKDLKSYRIIESDHTIEQALNYLVSTVDDQPSTYVPEQKKAEQTKRKKALESFFIQPENQSFLLEKTVNSKPLLLTFLTLEAYDKDFIANLLRNISPEELKKEFVFSAEERTNSSGTFLNYFTRLCSHRKDFAEVSEELIKAGIPFIYKVGRGNPAQPFQTLLQNQKYAEAVCLSLMEHQQDATLYFNIIRQSSNNGNSTLSSPTRRSSFAFSESHEPTAQSAIPNIKNLCANILQKAINSGKAILATEASTNENIASFLLRKSSVTNKTLGEESLEEYLWDIFQARQNLEKIPVQLFLMQDIQGKTLLHHMGLNANANLVRFVRNLIVENFGEGKWQEIIKIADNANALPLHYACAVGADGETEAFCLPELLSKEGGKLNLTPLAYAVRGKYALTCKILLQFGAAEVEYSKFVDANPLALAYSRSQETILEMLLQAGFSANQKLTTDRGEISLLEFAVSSERPNFDAIKKIVYYGAKVKDGQGQYLPYYASYLEKLSEGERNELIVQETAKRKHDHAKSEERFAITISYIETGNIDDAEKSLNDHQPLTNEDSLAKIYLMRFIDLRKTFIEKEQFASSQAAFSGVLSDISVFNKNSTTENAKQIDKKFVELENKIYKMTQNRVRIRDASSLAQRDPNAYTQ